jgi:ABC-type Fe3+/spermidine/putrescine transport system ATPase subunit
MLKIENLNFAYIEDQKILQEINLTIKNGEIIAFLGTSGSGKSTLLLSIAGLLNFNGEIKINNKRIQKPAEKLIAGHPDIKIVKQDYGLFPNMTVKENIAYELRYYEESYREKRITDLVEICEIQEIINRIPRQISGGQQQRTAIARAIAENPKILLLDEPFSHLDLENKIRLRNTIQKIVKQQKIACAFVTHEVEDALSLADQLVILENGRIIQKDNPETVYKQPINENTAKLTGLTNFIKINKKTAMIRPENIELSSTEKADNQAIVIKNNFIGRGYLIELKTDKNQKLLAFSLEKQEEESVYYTIKNSHTF